MFLLTAFCLLPTAFRPGLGRWTLGGGWGPLGSVGLLVHSFSDFNLHIPANALWFVALTACATCGTFARGPKDRPSWT